MAMGTRNPNSRRVLPDMKAGYEMISQPASILMGKNLYPLGRRAHIWVGTTHTRLPVAKIYPHQ
jgi:hypothetical protein